MNHNQNKGLSGSSLKLIAIVSMLIDHIGAVIIESWMRHPASYEQYHMLRSLDLVLRGIGRLAFPIFCFLLVEGFRYTHSKLKYARNLLLFAFISEIPFDLAFRHCLIDVTSQNVFFTLLIGLLTLIAIEQLSENPGKVKLGTILFVPSVLLFCSSVAWTMNTQYGIAGYLPENSVWMLAAAAAVGILIIFFARCTAEQRSKFARTVLPFAAGMAIAKVLKTDYNGIGVLAIVLMWVFRKSQAGSFGISVTCLSAENLFELPAFFDILLIRYYNGTRGRQIKYLFYAFYPVHLLILAAMNYILGFTAFTWLA